jgi:hypothetical protein
VPKVAQSIAFHDADDIWAVELSIEFKIVRAPRHTIFGPYIVRRTFLSKTSNRFSTLFFSTAFHCRTAGLSGSNSCRSLILSDVPGEMRTPIWLYLQTHVILPVSQELPSLQILVAKSHSLSGVENRPISSRNHDFVYCSLIFSPFFAPSA